MSARLSLALESGGLDLPATGNLAVLHPRIGTQLSSLPTGRVSVVQPAKPDFDHFRSLGFDCVPDGNDPAGAVIVFLPRAKALAKSLIAQASHMTRGLVIVDGAKSDGIDSLLKACRARTGLLGTLSKAHGKIFWFEPGPDTFDDWRGEPQVIDGYVTAPGVFSADGVDPASFQLAAALPSRPGRHVIDLGAGWGYLSARLLQDPEIERVDLVEADHAALDCARRNVSDLRARFHWADATKWTPDSLADTVVMNPPFHTGRAADPSLGRAFVTAAARMLHPSGHLWMVANRHLPYEAALSDGFGKVQEVGGDSRFKILHAVRPKVRGKPVPIRTRR